MGVSEKTKVSKNGKRVTTRTKHPFQLSSSIRNHLKKPLGNFEILKWIDYLEIPNFKLKVFFQEIVKIMH